MSVASTLSDSAPLQGPEVGEKIRNLRKVTTGPTVLRGTSIIQRGIHLPAGCGLPVIFRGNPKHSDQDSRKLKQ